MAAPYANAGAANSGDRQRRNSFGLNVSAAENSDRARTTQAPSGLPGNGRAVLSHAAHVPAPPLGEESDGYPVIASLNDRWRVMACRQSIQWILQRRGGVDHWRGQYFCRTREALIRCVHEHGGQIGGDALAILLRLPERFPEGAP